MLFFTLPQSTRVRIRITLSFNHFWSRITYYTLHEAFEVATPPLILTKTGKFLQGAVIAVPPNPFA